MLKNRDAVADARTRTSHAGRKRNRGGLFQRLCRRLGGAPGAQPAGRSTFEGLEARQMLATVPLTAGQFMLYDSTNAGPNDVDIIAVGSATSASVTVTVNSTDGGAGNADVINSIDIAGPGTGANVVVELMLSGPITGPITYTGAGDNVTLRIFQEQVNDAAGGGYGDALTGATSGITAGGAGADQTPAETTNAAADGDSLSADGNLGAINVPVAVVGGAIRATVGNTGIITLGSVNLTSNLTIQVDNAGANAIIGGLTVTGGTTPGNFSFTATVAKGAGAAGAVSISNGATITVGGTGAINVTADATATVAAVTAGDIQLLATAGPAASVNIFSVNALVGITGAVTVGNISNAGTNAGNVVNIGHAGTSVGGNFLVGNITNTAANDGGDVTLSANNIAGGLTIGSISTSDGGTAATLGDVGLAVFGNVTGAVSIAAGGTITIGDVNQADGGVFVATFVGTTLGGVTVGDIALNTTAAGNAVVFNFVGNAGAITVGNITAQGAGNQAGNVAITAAGNTGQISIGNVTLGDSGQTDTSAVSLTVVGTSGGLAVGDISLSSSGGSFTAGLVGNTGDISLGAVTTQGPGTMQAGGILVQALGNAGAVSVGNISMGDQGDAADISLLLVQVGGTSSSLTIGDVDIANAGQGAVFAFGGDMSGGISVGTVTLQNPGVANNGSLIIQVDDGVLGAPFADVGGDIGIAVGGTITVGDAGDADGAALRLVVEGTSGNVTLGNIISSGNAGAPAVWLNLGGGTGDLTLGDVTMQGPGTVQSNIILVQALGNAGAVSVGNISMGDQGDAADISLLQVWVAGTSSSLTIGDVDIANAAQGAVFRFVGDMSGGISVGTVTLQNPGVANNGSLIIQVDDGVLVAPFADVGGDIGIAVGGTITVGDAGDMDGAALLLVVEGTSGDVTLGNISSSGNAGVPAVRLVLGGGTGDLTLGDVTMQGPGTVQSNNVQITVGGAVGNIVLGNMALGDSGDADTADFLLVGLAPGGNWGSLTIGTIDTDGTGGATVTIAPFQTGSINGISIDDMNLLGTGNDVTIGQISGATSTGALGNVTLKNLTMVDSSLTIQGRDIDTVDIAGTWNVNGAGSATLTADAGAGGTRDGVMGNVGQTGANTWDINFAPFSTGSVRFMAADGVGSVTINSVDFIAANFAQQPAGGIGFNADSDGDGTGPIGDFVIRFAGDDTTGLNLDFTVDAGSQPNIAFNAASFIIAADGGNVSIAGGAMGLFDATSGPTNAGNWGNFILGRDANGFPIAQSDSDGITIGADDGVGTVTLYGVFSQMTNASIDANVDGDAIGALGDVVVTGEAGALSLSDAGAPWLAASFGNITLQNGNFSVSLTTNIAAAADRIATISSLGNVTIVNGAVVNFPSFTIDDGIGAITVTNLTPFNADAWFGNIISDADGALGGAAVGGGIASISVGGSLWISLVDSDGVNDTTYRASEDVGPITAGEGIVMIGIDIGGHVGAIQAGGSIAIGHVDVNGDMPSVRVVKPGSASDLVADFIELGTFPFSGTFWVGGNVDIIESGLGADDYIIIADSAAGPADIMGDLDRINAGAGNVTIPNGLRIHAGTRGSAVYVITDSGVDYILAIYGTWAAGNNAATIDTTVTFLDPGNINSVLINDLEGVTSSADTGLMIVTRSNPVGLLIDYTAGVGADNTPEFFNLDGFQDDLKTGLYDPPPPPPIVLHDGQHGFYQIMIEGDLNGPMGADAFPSDGWFNSLFAADTPILGEVRNLEIVGNWNNAVATIYVLAIGDISYGSLSIDRMAAVAGAQFSFDSRLLVGGDGVAGPSGNSNGTNEDLEVYSALSPSSDTDVVIVVPDGGSITKSWVGPTGAFEYITFTDTDLDGVVNTVVLNFSSGVIASMYLYGENWGIEYNALDPTNPGTDASTDIYYGVAYPSLGFAASVFTNAGGGSPNVIDFLEFSSPIGNVTVMDADTSDQFGANVGNVMVGYVVAIDSASDISGFGLDTFIDNANPGNGLVYSAAGAVITAGTGALYVEGSLGGVAASGDVGSIQTVDTVTEPTPAWSANFLGLVTDGSVGAITIDGSVLTSLVVGDRIWTAGPDGLWGTADDVVGINGTPAFLDDINIADDAGSSVGDVVTNIVSTLPPVQTPTITGDQISAPDGIGVNITVGGALWAAIVSGKRILVDLTQDQNDDDISGNIIASEIFGDIWSGDDIGTGVNGATVIYANGAKTGSSGDISGIYQPDNQIDIIATGASPGDITSDIIATGDMVNFLIQAGTGSGGSILANIVAGRQTAAEVINGIVGTGAMITLFGGQNHIIADQDVGALGINVISAADGIFLNSLIAGNQTVEDPLAVPADPIDGGNINSDVIAGVPVNAMGPVEYSIVDSTIPIMRNANASITINLMGAGIVDGPDQDGNLMNDSNSDVNGILTAAGSIIIGEMYIDGDVIGNDGVPGRHVIAAGMGWLGSATPFAGGATNHAVVAIYYAQITDSLAGTISAGMFVPFWNVNNSPINANDLAPLQAGTVLTLGEVIISSMTVGTWDQSATGSSGTNGITLAEMLAGTETGANQAFAPTWSIGATHDITAYIDVVGRPWVAPQTGPGSVSPNPADADGTAISIAAFGSVAGNLWFNDSADFTFVMSNIDAVTAIDTNGVSPGNPSSPSTNLWLNAGQAGGGIGADNALNITAAGFGTGGLDVDFFTAGLDYFVRLNTGGVPTAANAPAGSTTTTPLQASFWTSWGMGNINAILRAQDADPTDGLEAGDLSFALIAAGQNVAGDFVATDDIIARTDGPTTDGSAGFSTASGLFADFAAGLSANVALDPTGMASLFPGGNFAARVVAGDDVRRTAAGELVGLVARAGRDSALGNFTAAFRLISGAEDQIYDSDLSSDINAFVNASNSVLADAIIDAGDTQGAFGGVTNGGLGGVSGRAGGSFYGGVWAGSGTDLDINTTADNIVTADMDGTIRTVDDLDVRAVGIYAENAMDGGVIEVGYGLAGGNLLGNIVAEGRITEIEVFGDVGSALAPAMIYTGDYVARLLIGNARTIATSALNSVRASGLTYISSFGTLYGSIFQGGNSNAGAGGIVGGATPILYIGGTIAPTSNIAIGSQWGVGGMDFEIGGDRDTYTIAGGEGAFFIAGGNLGSGIPNAAAPGHGAVDAVLTGTGVSLTVDGTTTGTGAGLRSVLVGDSFGGLTINDGAVGQITVDDDVDVAGLISAFLSGLVINPQQFAFLANSLPSASEIAVMFNNDIAPVGITGAINVDYNIGNNGADATLPVSIGAGLNAAKSNYAIRTQGALTANITSNLGSVGNIVVGTTIGGVTLSAFRDLGDLWVELGDITGVTFIARTGSMGVVSGEDNVTVNITGVRENVGGAIARTGALTATISVHGSVGLLQASGNISATVTTEVGDIGFDLDATDQFTVINGAGIYSDLGAIAVTFTAGGDVDNISAFGNVTGTIMAQGDVGNVTSRMGEVAMGDPGDGVVGITTGGSLGNLWAYGSVTGIYNAGNSIGNVTSHVANVNVTLHAVNDIGNIRASTNVAGDYSTEAGDIGSVTADSGNVGGVYLAVGNIGQVTAFLSVSGTYTAGGSIAGFDAVMNNVGVTASAGVNIGTIHAGGSGNISGTFETLSGDIGPVVTDLGTITAFFWAGRDVVSVTAGDSIDSTVMAMRNIGPVTSVAGNVAGTYQAVGNIGQVTAFLDISGSYTAGGAAAGFDAIAGSISATVHTVGAIGDIHASIDISGEYRTEAGDIGNITSDTGTISGTFWAVGNIGNVTAVGYEISNAVFSATGDVGNVWAFANIWDTEIEAGGSVGAITANWNSIDGLFVQAGQDIGAITAGTDIDGEFIAERGQIGAVTSVAGDVWGDYQAGTTIVSVTAFRDIHGTYVAGGDVGNLTATTGEICDCVVVHAGGGIGNITASMDIDGTFTAETGPIGSITTQTGSVVGTFTSAGGIGDVSSFGDLTGTFVAGGSIGSLLSKVGALAARAHAAGSIGDLTASMDIRGVYIAETGSIGNIRSYAGGIVEDEETDGGETSQNGGTHATIITAGAAIGTITVATDIEGAITAGAGIGLITSGGNLLAAIRAGSMAGLNIGGSIGIAEEVQATVSASGAIGDIQAGTIVFATISGGSIGNVTATRIAGLDLSASGSIGNITASTGDIAGGVVITAGMNIGNVTAGGSIGAVLTAIGDIGNIEAKTGSLMGWITSWDYVANNSNITVTFLPPSVAAGNGGTVVVGDVYGDMNSATADGGSVIGPVMIQVSGSGAIQLKPGSVSGNITAGGNIGNIFAFKNIGNYNIQAGGRIGTVSTSVGDIGAEQPVEIRVYPADLRISEIQSTNTLMTFTTMAGSLRIVAGGQNQGSVVAMGKIAAGNDIRGGMAPANVTVNGVNIAVASPTTFHAVRGSIGGIEAVGGSIGDISAKAGVNIGDIDASENIGGSYIAETGSIGHIISKVGDIGSAADPIYIRANGGVQIDPDTLLFTPRPNMGRDGVGNIYAYLGSIYLDLKSGGDVGVWGSTVRGGIAAPLGTVNGSVVVGGDLGGISGGLGVNLTQNVVLGAVGIYRNLEGGTVRLSSSRPFSVDVGGVTYTVAVENVLTGLAVYRVVGNQLIFDSVSISRDPANTVNANISITGRFPVADNTPTEGTGDTGATTGNVLVKQLTINGHAGNITIDGSVEKLNVNGNLRDGEVIISGRLGSAFVTRDIGRLGDLSNMTLRVGQGFGSLKAGGTNWGLYTITLKGGEVYSITNANRGIINNDSTRNSDNFVNIYLAKGTAKITINNGQIDTITLMTRGAEDLAVFTTASAVDATPDDKKSVWIGRYPKLKASINKRIHFMRETPSTGDTAYVARINTKAPRQQIRGIHIAGSVGDIAFGAGSIVDGVTVTRNAGRIMSGSVVKDVTVWGDLGTISSTTVQSLDLRGSAGRIAGQVVQYATVGGNVDVVSGSKLVRSVRVAGNAGSVTSGGILQSLFINGSAITISGNEIKSVQVAGSVGVEVTGGAFGGLSLGAAFSAADVQRILGTADLAQVGDVGPNGGRFLGGIDARARAVNVTVGGLIADLSFRTTGNDMSQLIGQVVDDALIGVAKNAAWQKTDGVLVKFAVQPITGPADAVIRAGGTASNNGGEEPAEPTPVGTIGQ